jgi:hypothetical protein
LAYISLVLLSTYIIFDLLRSIDKKFVKDQLTGEVPVKTTGWFLVFFGSMFLIRSIGMLAPTIPSQTLLPVSEVGTLVADLVLSTLWIAGGTMLLRRMALGFVSGLGLLFSASMLFVGLVIFLLLQPVLTDAPFVLFDVIVVLILGLICCIPFFLFLRGTLSKGISS